MNQEIHSLLKSRSEMFKSGDPDRNRKFSCLAWKSRCDWRRDSSGQVSGKGRPHWESLRPPHRNSRLIGGGAPASPVGEGGARRGVDFRNKGGGSQPGAWLHEAAALRPPIQRGARRGPALPLPRRRHPPSRTLVFHFISGPTFIWVLKSWAMSGAGAPRPVPDPASGPCGGDLATRRPCLSLHKARPCKALFTGTGVASPCGPQVLSPVTNLALNMVNLRGLGSNSDTPKRRPNGTPLLNKTLSSDSDAGLCMDSPSPMDEKEIDETFEKAVLESGKVIANKIPMRRMNSLPLSFLGSSPALKSIHCDSPDSEVLCPESSCIHSSEGDKENEVFEFKKPVRPVSRNRLFTFHSGNRQDQRPSSAPALMLSSNVGSDLVDVGSPVFLHRSSLTSSLNEEDDGFLELLDEDVENETDVPSGMESLLNAPIVTRKEITGTLNDGTPSKLSCDISSKSPGSALELRSILKRQDRPKDEETPVKNKRRRSLAGTTVEGAGDKANQRTLLRSKSFCDAKIERVLAIDDGRRMIGDFSKPYILPTVEGRHQELQYITPEMVIQLVTGKFDGFVERFLLFDCRYPYEYEGGHIKGALNLHMEDEVEDLLKKPIVPVDEAKRVIIIFHCEFSSERGPRMCRFLREKDREVNGTDYPKLHYPELYVLKGGYREFFPKFKLYCEPQGYRPMNHEDFRDDLRKFRLKSRTWAGERSKRDMYSRLKKL
ncbi:M-phase inducer phosphatase 2 [Pristis pectinata]|uniref:M-phase inducer phosphatase 2 n=1 Tax=Pristis pectinata TaxID=685728 RepID=UPI00223CBEFE|nr:M-phase inducer phosphatase 2 [Pristis pectinata]